MLCPVSTVLTYMVRICQAILIWSEKHDLIKNAAEGADQVTVQQDRQAGQEKCAESD